MKKYWRWFYGNIIIASFTDDEEETFQETIKWLSEKLCIAPVIIQQSNKEFSINPFSRMVTNKCGNQIYLSAREFDLLYFLYSHYSLIKNSFWSINPY